MDACELNKNGYKLQVQNRGEGRGGGIGVVYRDNITVNKVDGGSHSSFEFAVWSVKFTTVHLSVITIYHPPSTMQNNKDNQFIDQFTEWLSENLPILPNVVITGNFNIHVNCKEWDNNAHIFTDTLKALGLQFHNDFQTHRLGNTLDFLITEINSQIQIDKCWAGIFISDHSTIEASLSISRSDLIKKHVAYRRLKDIQPEAIANNFDKLTSEIIEVEIQNLDELVDICEHKLKTVLDNHAPMMEKSVTIRHTVPWFTTEITAQKRKV